MICNIGDVVLLVKAQTKKRAFKRKGSWNVKSVPFLVIVKCEVCA